MSDRIPRSDFSLAPGESARLFYTVRNRAGVGIETGSGDFEAEWRLYEDPEGEPILTLSFNNRVYADLENPYRVVVQIQPSDTEALGPGIYHHALWAAVAGEWKRSSLGTLRISGRKRDP